MRILTVVGGVAVAAMLGALVWGWLNDRLHREVMAKQAQFQQAQQWHSTLENLAGRMAQLGQTNQALLDLLKRHDLSVNLNVNGKTVRVP